MSRDEVDAADAVELRKVVPEILAAVRRLLDEVRTRDYGDSANGDEPVSARVGWL